MTMVTWLRSSLISSSTLAVDIGSRAEAGSSISSTEGDTAMARAMQSLCCWPPERANADSLSLSLTSSQRAAPRRDSSTLSRI